MPTKNENGKFDPDTDVTTYRRIRRAIGFLGIGLPFVLVLFSFIPFFITEVQPSISHYYFSNLRELFTGTLCAVGLFLIRYDGYKNESIWKNDSLLTNIAGAMAFGVALVPTEPIVGSQLLIYTIIPYDCCWLKCVHYGFAAVLFLIFALLAINVFTIGQKDEIKQPKSLWNENNIYRFCGYSIIACMALLFVFSKLNWFMYSTLFFEALSLMLFGIAWLIKGRALGDTGMLGQKLYRENNGV